MRLHADGADKDYEVSAQEIPVSNHLDFVRISVAALSHVPVDIDIGEVESIINSANIGALGVACTSEYDQVGKSVALMDFIEDGRGSHVCKATPMNDRVSTGTLHILGANHCIATQSVASTLITYWN